MTAEDEVQDELIAVNKKGIESLIKITEQQKREIDELTESVKALEEVTSKKGWKVAVTIIAAVAFVMSVLQAIL